MGADGSLYVVTMLFPLLDKTQLSSGFSSPLAISHLLPSMFLFSYSTTAFLSNYHPFFFSPEYWDYREHGIIGNMIMSGSLSLLSHRYIFGLTGLWVHKPLAQSNLTSVHLQQKQKSDFLINNLKAICLLTFE